MIKWIGQHIVDLIARFRSDVYLEDISSGTIASGGNLGLDSNNKIVKANEASGGISFDGSTANGVLTYKDSDEASVESTLTYDSETLTIGVDDDGDASIKRLAHSDEVGGDLIIMGGNSGGTDKLGGDLNLYSGAGTGTAYGGDINFYAGNRDGSTGSSNNLPTLMATIDGSAGDFVMSGIDTISGKTNSDFMIASDGNLTFRIDADNDETSQEFSFLNATTEIMNLDESGNLQIDGGLTTGSTSFVNSSGVIQVASQTNITGLGTIGTGTWQGTSIATTYTAAKVTSIVAGDGIDVSGATGDVTVTAETATDSNPGVVELATTAEADTGTDTARAVTPAGLKSHVDAKHYDILHVNGFMGAASTNQYQGYGGHYNFNIGVTPYTDSGTIGNANATKWGHYVAMSNCTIDRIMYRASDTGGGGGDNYSFELWKYTAVNDSASNTTTTKLGSIDITGDANGHYVHHVVDTTGYELDEGETFLPVIRKTSSAWAGNILFECALRFRYDAS